MAQADVDSLFKLFCQLEDIFRGILPFRSINPLLPLGKCPINFNFIVRRNSFSLTQLILQRARRSTFKLKRPSSWSTDLQIDGDYVWIQYFSKLSFCFAHQNSGIFGTCLQMGRIIYVNSGKRPLVRTPRGSTRKYFSAKQYTWRANFPTCESR